MNATNARATRLTAALLVGMSFFAALDTATAAESRLAPIMVQATLDVRCDAPRVPGQQEIGRAFEVRNFSQTYDLRNRVQHIVTRACQNGADRVLFTLAKPTQPDTLRYVALED